MLLACYYHPVWWEVTTRALLILSLVPVKPSWMLWDLFPSNLFDLNYSHMDFFLEGNVWPNSVLCAPATSPDAKLLMFWCNALNSQHPPSRGLIASCSLFSIIVIIKISQISVCKDSLCGAEPKKANTIHGDSPRETLSFYVSRRYFAESCLTGEEDNRKGVRNTWKIVASTWRFIMIFCDRGNNATCQDWWITFLLGKTLIFI